jgi:hypothetical protein
MPETDAATLGRTYNCKTPHCVNESRGPVGRNAYCEDCQRRRAQTGGSVPPQDNASMIARLNSLKGLATAADRAKERAKKATVTALRAKKEAEAAQEAFQAAMREIGGQS